MRKSLNLSINFLILLLEITTFYGCATGGVRHPEGIAPRRADVGQQSLGGGTGIESQDIVQVTDQMARSIIGIDAIAKAAKPPVIAIYPVTNDTRLRINGALFTERILGLLNKNCQGKIRFIVRDPSKINSNTPDIMTAIEREKQLKDAGTVTSGKAAPMLGADYFLTGKLLGQSQASSTGRSDYVLYSFTLVDTETTETVWQDMAEIKKEGLEDAIYR
jgi:penicillin-binding protein activator